MKTFYANGKLLLSGEYLVLKGAIALGLPVRFGQSLEIGEDTGSGLLEWETFVYKKSWLKATFRTDNFDIVSTNKPEKAAFLSHLLQEAQKRKKKKKPGAELAKRVKSVIHFDIEWGLGSSAGLISNVARWFDVDPYKVTFRLTNGSGYDIACARSKQPVFYRIDKGKPEINPVRFNPEFQDKLYFIYLGNKQISAASVEEFNTKEVEKKYVELISGITRKIAFARKLEQFNFFLSEHERVIAEILQQPTLKESRFHDFPGEVKSLGAWGGDFALVTYEGTYKELVQYFEGKDIHVIFPFHQIILN